MRRRGGAGRSNGRRRSTAIRHGDGLRCPGFSPFRIPGGGGLQLRRAANVNNDVTPRLFNAANSSEPSLICNSV
jgi:hypothetical protein